MPYMDAVGTKLTGLNWLVCCLKSRDWNQASYYFSHGNAYQVIEEFPSSNEEKKTVSWRKFKILVGHPKLS